MGTSDNAEKVRRIRLRRRTVTPVRVHERRQASDPGDDPEPVPLPDEVAAPRLRRRVDVRRQTWFVKTTCKYIDFRLEKNREAVLYSVIPSFGGWTDEINVHNVLHLCSTNSVSFFLVCVRTLSAITDMHPFCVVYDLVRRYTVPNHKVQESFFRLYSVRHGLRVLGLVGRIEGGIKTYENNTRRDRLARW